MNVLKLIPNKYPGGIAIWGALPAVFNNSICPDDNNGVHVHARMIVGGKKHIDETFDIVEGLCCMALNNPKIALSDFKIPLNK